MVAVAVIVAIVVFILGFLGFIAVKGTRPVRLLQRLGILFVVQTVLVSAFGLQVNYKLGFFRNTSDLIGLFSPDPVVQHAQPVDTNATPAEIAKDPRYKLQWSDTEEDGVKQAEIVGPQSGVDGEVRAWVPKGYPEKDTEYDVIVMLPGTPGSSAAITTAIGAQESLQDAIDAGTIPPTILVTADMNIGGEPTTCADLEGDYQVESWLAKDVPAVIRANFNVTPDRKGWTILGPSMGAYCSIRIALTHSDTFANAAWLHGINEPLSEKILNNPDMKREQTLSNLVKQDHLPLNMLLVSSQEDPGTVEDARAIAQSAPKTDGVTQDELKKGGHGWVQWEKEFPDVLKWLGEIIKGKEAKQ